ALEVYLRHMKPGGVIAVHVTNRFVNLVPVVAALVETHHLHALLVVDPRSVEPAIASDWMLISDQRNSLEQPRLLEAATRIQARPDWAVWTDEFNNLVQTLK